MRYPIKLKVSKHQQLYYDKNILMIGQPLAVMMYYHDYVVDHFGEEEIQAFADLKTFHNSSAIV